MKMTKTKTLLLIFFFYSLAWCTGLRAQQMVACPLPVGSGTSYCWQACIYCDLDGLLDSNTVNTFVPISVCNGSIPLNNPRWYGFIAGSQILALDIVPITNLKGTDGLQAAIVDLEDCNADEAPGVYVACAPGAAGGAGQTISLLATDLIPGHAYRLVVDGFNGGSSKYKIRVALGTTAPQPLGPLNAINGPKTVCPKAVAMYNVPPVENVVSYTWSAPTGSKIDGTNFNTITKSGTGANMITVKYGTVGGTICVTASNLCSPPVTRCLTVTNTAITPTTLPTRTLCYEELPFQWEEEPFTPINAPGTYLLTSKAYASYLGCDSVVKQKIIVNKRKQKTLPPTWLCEGNCLDIGGNQFCDSGTYQQTITAADGCDSTLNFTIIRIANKAVVQKPDTITCVKSTVKLTSKGSSTGPPVSYNWINSAGQVISTADTAVATSPGKYSLIVISVGGGKFCRDTASVSVVGSTSVPTANAGPPKTLSCDVTEVQLQGTGSTGPQFVYLWTASNGGNIVMGSNTPTPIVNQPGTYTLRVTNTVNGCTAESFVQVDANLTPPQVSVQSGEFNCEVTFFTLNVTTDATAPTYAWSGPNGYSSSLASPLVNVEGIYTVTITNGNGSNGCTATATASVTANTAPPGATATGAVLTCATTTAVISGNSSAPNSVFKWTGPDGFISDLQNPSITAPGVYTLEVTASNFCTSTATTSVTLNTTPPGASLSVSGNLNCNAPSVNVIVASTAPANRLNHVWTLPDGSTVPTGSNAVWAATQPGAYSVVVTDSLNGCTSTASAPVVKNADVTASAALGQDVSCFGQNNGSASSTAGGGTGSFAYKWNNGVTTAAITGLVAGTYTVTVNDSNNCSATASVTVTQPTLLAANASATPQTLNGASDGTATATPTGGTSPYTYQWNTAATPPAISGLLPGAYTVTVTDTKNCSSIETVTVNAFNCTIQASVNPTNATCNGANNGAASLTVTIATPPYTYQWSNGATTPTVSDLAPGAYSVTVTDASNCPSQLSFTISEPNAVKANAVSTDASGPVAQDGAASAGPTGGTPPYTYLWSNDSTTASINGIAPGSYTVTVTDANNCTAVQTVVVSFLNCTLVPNIVAQNPACNGQATGQATVVLTGGVAPFGYAWSNGGTTATINNIAANTYTVTVTDAVGCSLTTTTALTDPALLTLSITESIDPTCPNASNGAITANASGGTGMVGYQWNIGQSGPTISGLPVGTYTVVVTDANGCSAVLSNQLESFDLVAPEIAQSAPPTVSLDVSGIAMLTQQNLNLQVTDNCTVQNVSLSPNQFKCDDLGTKTVTVTATDEAGNKSTMTVTVTIVDDLAPVLSCPSSITRCFGDDVVDYQAPTVSDNCIFGGNFTQPSGLPSGAKFPTGVTINTYAFSDQAGNTGTCSFEVTILSQVSVTVVTVVNDINNQNSGSIDISVNGGLSPYAFQWVKNGGDIPGATNEDLTGIGAGTYTVRITDKFGCKVTGPPVVILPSATDEPAWAYGFSIRPNPTPGQVEVLFPQLTPGDIQLYVYDQTGRVVARQYWAQQQRLELDFSSLPDGLYTVLIRVENDLLVRKIVVSR